MQTDLPLLKEKIVRSLNVVQLYEHALAAMLNEAIHLSSANSSGWHKKVRCPFHDDTEPSFAVNSVSGGFKCFACNKVGSLFDFWMDYKGYRRETDFTKAMQELADLARVDVKEWHKSSDYQQGIERAKQHNQDKIKPETKAVNKADVSDEAHLAISENVISEFQALLGPDDYTYLSNVRGLTLETIQQYKIGWNPEPKVRTVDGSYMKGRYTIPVYNKNGECRNIRQYSQYAPASYKMLNYKPDKDTSYGSPPRIFCLDQLYTRKISTICICEGEFDTMLLNQKLKEAGLSDWLAITNTHGAGTFELEWLEVMYDKAVYFLYDTDEAGKRESASHCSKYFLGPLKAGRFISVKNVLLPLEGSKEYKDLTDYFIKLNKSLEELLVIIQSTPNLESGGVGGDEATIPPMEVGNLMEAMKDRQYIDKRIRVPLTISGQSNRTYHAVRSFKVTRCFVQNASECCSDFKEKMIPYGHDMFIHSSTLSKAQVMNNLRYMACEKNEKCSVEVIKKVIMEEHFAHQRVKRFLARENTEGKIENVTEITPVSVYILQPERHIQIQPQDYMATGWVRSHPQTSQVAFFIEQMEPLENDWEQFKVTEESKKELAVFSGMSFMDIMLDISNHVTHIYDSYRILGAVLLTYCSPLWINFNHEITRGWINACILGDSGVGKSSTYMRIADYIDLGDLFSVLTGGRTGLLYAIRQRLGEWHVHIGRYVSADRKIIAIDEAQRAKREEMTAMAIAMDKGELDISRVVEATYRTRTRTVLLMNAPEGKTLASYPHGCMALSECFDPMFIRRLDIAVLCPSRTDNAFFNKYTEQKVKSGKISAEALRTLIYWAWTRTSKNIIWEQDATKYCLEEATKLSNDYGDANDVPLLNATDCRFTIARLASAHAVLTGRFTPDFESCTVTRDSVEEIVVFLRTMYSDTSCNLAYYSSLLRHKNRLSDYDNIKLAFEKVIAGATKAAAKNGQNGYQNENLFCQLLLILRQGEILRPIDLRDHLSASPRWIKHHVAVLAAYSLVELTKFGYKPTPKFNSFMSKWSREDITEYDNSGMPKTHKVSEMLDAIYSRIGEKIVAMIQNPQSKEQVTNDEFYEAHHSDQEYQTQGTVNEPFSDPFTKNYEDFDYGDEA